MVWRQNEDRLWEWFDIRGRLTVFGRIKNQTQTYAGVRSPDGTEWFIQVDDAGVISTGEPATASGFTNGFDSGFGIGLS